MLGNPLLFVVLLSAVTVFGASLEISDVQETLRTFPEQIRPFNAEISTIAILRVDFSNGSSNEAGLIENEVLVDLIDAGFRVIERQNLASLLEEVDLGTAGYISEESMIKKGKMIGVDAFLVGSCQISRRVLTCNLRLIQTETGAVIWTGRFSGERWASRRFGIGLEIGKYSSNDGCFK